MTEKAKLPPLFYSLQTVRAKYDQTASFTCVWMEKLRNLQEPSIWPSSSCVEFTAIGKQKWTRMTTSEKHLAMRINGVALVY